MSLQCIEWKLGHKQRLEMFTKYVHLPFILRKPQRHKTYRIWHDGQICFIILVIVIETDIQSGHKGISHF